MTTEIISYLQEENYRLSSELTKARQELERVYHCQLFGILTRQGLLKAWEETDRTNKAIAFLDIDRLHELNEKVGYEESNFRISSSLVSVRDSEDEKIGRWQNGDEVVLWASVFSIEAIILRLKEDFNDHGLSFTCAIGLAGSESLQECVKPLSDEVLMQKALGSRGGVLSLIS